MSLCCNNEPYVAGRFSENENLPAFIIGKVGQSRTLENKDENDQGNLLLDKIGLYNFSGTEHSTNSKKNRR